MHQTTQALEPIRLFIFLLEEHFLFFLWTKKKWCIYPGCTTVVVQNASSDHVNITFSAAVNLVPMLDDKFIMPQISNWIPSLKISAHSAHAHVLSLCVTRIERWLWKRSSPLWRRSAWWVVMFAVTRQCMAYFLLQPVCIAVCVVCSVDWLVNCSSPTTVS